MISFSQSDSCYYCYKKITKIISNKEIPNTMYNVN